MNGRGGPCGGSRCATQGLPLAPKSPRSVRGEPNRVGRLGEARSLLGVPPRAPRAEVREASARSSDEGLDCIEIATYNDLAARTQFRESHRVPPKLTLVLTATDGKWRAVFLEIEDINSQGATKEEAFNALVATLQSLSAANVITRPAPRSFPFAPLPWFPRPLQQLLGDRDERFMIPTDLLLRAPLPVAL